MPKIDEEARDFMRQHVANDELVKYQMDLLEDAQKSKVRVHLERCRKCKSLFEKVEDDLRRLRGFDPALEIVVPPLTGGRRGHVWPILRMAAILAIGFLLGAYSSESLRPSLVEVVPQNLITRPPTTSVGQFTVCP